MQPCQVCGGMAVDAAGYCTQCGTFRGVPQPGYPGQQPGYPTQPQPGYPTQPQPGYPGQPPGGYADPTYGAPYPGAPVSGQPASGPPTYPYQQPAPTAQYPQGPVSSPPGYMGQMSAPPMSGPPGYPAYPVAAPVPQKRSMVVPFVVGGIAVVLLIASIIVVLVVKSSGKGGVVADPSHTATGTPTPTRSSVIDSCLVGKWKVTSEQLTVDFGSTYGEVDLTLAGSYTVTFGADGTAVEDYGTKTEFDGRAGGHTFGWQQDGTLSYDLRTAANRMTFTGSVPNGNYAAYVDSSRIDSGTNTFSYKNMTYSCSGNSLSREAANSSRTIDSMRMSRVG